MTFCECNPGFCRLTRAECARKGIRCRWKNGAVRPVEHFVPPTGPPAEPRDTFTSTVEGAAAFERWHYGD